MLFIVKFKPLKLGSSIHHFGQLGDSKSRIHSEWAWNLANRNLWSYWWPRHIYPVNLCRWADGYASKLTQVTRIYNAYSEHGLNWIQSCEWGRKTHLNPVGRQLVFSPSGWPCVCPLVVIFQAFFFICLSCILEVFRLLMLLVWFLLWSEFVLLFSFLVVFL